MEHCLPIVSGVCHTQGKRARKDCSTQQVSASVRAGHYCLQLLPSPALVPTPASISGGWGEEAGDFRAGETFAQRSECGGDSGWTALETRDS